MCVYSTLSWDKLEYTHMAPLKLDLRFQINSNGFSRDRSFGHESHAQNLICSLLSYLVANQTEIAIIIRDMYCKMFMICGKQNKTEIQTCVAISVILQKYRLKFLMLSPFPKLFCTKVRSCYLISIQSNPVANFFCNLHSIYMFDGTHRFDSGS